MKKLYRASMLLAILFCFFVAPTFSFALSPTEQAQEQGSTGMRPDGYSQNQSDTAASVDEYGLVPCTLTECTFCDLLKLMERIFFWLLSIAFAVAVFCVVVSGFAYILSVGDNTMMGWAKEGIKLSLVGFAICLLAWLGIHVLYTVLGYKGNWWQMECADEKQNSNLENNVVASLYANEISPDSLGGRNKPIALPDLAVTGLKDIPENKYFFVHGLGGQPLDRAAEQVAKIAREAKEQKRIVYAVTPYYDTDGNPQGAKLTNLINYITNNNDKTLENFSNLLLGIVKDNPSLETALIQVARGETDIAQFNKIWPQNLDFYEGEGSLFKTLSTMTKEGVLYKETGPIIINWPDGQVPKNFSDFSINIDYDEKTGKYIIDVDDPVDITLPNNISPSAARAAARDFSKVLSALEGRKDLWNSEEDILTELTSLLQKSADLKDELDEQGGHKGNDSGIYRDFIEDEEGNLVKSRDWESNGTGVLPSGIATTASSGVKWPQHSDLDKLDKATRDLEKELQDWIKNEINQGTSDGSRTGDQTTSSTTGGDRTSGTGRTGTDTSGQGSDTPISSDVISGAAADPNSMVSLVSVGINGRRLNIEERGKIRDLIINIQKEEMDNLQKNKYNPLNIPPDYVMCLMQAESIDFNPVAVSPTGAAGLGQHTDDSQMEAAQMMKKTAPKHYEEFSKKYGKDLTQLMSSRTSGKWNVKNTLRRDANLAAAMTYDFVQVKARNVLKMNRAVSMNDLRRITYAYVGDGNEGSQWNKIQKCMTNSGWSSIAKKK